ncbi:hypothetical protein AVEN_264708-1 [Araneus ventricosus]|uniref:Uncharacterized protein n=1 Tax=Araneus ventricosus TaxID=182803 RepID=A0A4Y2TND2_ARAVE|nr:hypothetical protein AVEN_151761-1 [Araneus ventricosus]GBN91133.1 hypothetical protein AVEN_213673-1 [Araneus ventricosus]GBO01561.1 hypothetical protein AVEN_167607-1 [Araneus ventricosus]GBO01567.1 hypothetical protein AVEN_264708-1 [Araneus ventricosus]
MDIVSQANETDELSNVTVRLCVFHLFMSYMGAVGKIMGGSALEDMWYEAFAKNAVLHMANEHAYGRALRAHSLSRATIARLILEYCEEDGFLIGFDDENLRRIHN